MVTATVLALALLATPALAETITWNLPAGQCPHNSNWSHIQCWDLGRAPETGDDVVFAIPGVGASNDDLASSVQLHSVTLNPNADYTITGGPMVLQSGGSITSNTTNTGGTDLLGTGVTLNGPATFTRAAGGQILEFGGAITGTGGLTLVNNGVSDGLRLSVANSYTGATIINGTARVFAAVNGAIPTGSAVNVNGSILFQTSSTIGSLAGGGAGLGHCVRISH